MATDKKKDDMSSIKKSSSTKSKSVGSKKDEIPLNEHIKESQIGVIFIDKASKEQIGFIKFDFSGVLVYQMIKTGMHVFAFKPIDRLVRQWEKEPLYVKYAELLEKNSKLPDEILKQEAKYFLKFLNSLEKPISIGLHTVKALVVHPKNQ